jgi:carbamate kinase
MPPSSFEKWRKNVIIGELNQAMKALRGDAGTQIVCDDA